MSDERFDQFLREHAPEIPPAKLGERERIWRAIESLPLRGLAWWWVAVPIAALAALVLVKIPSDRDREITRILTAAIAYEAEGDPDSGFP